MAHSEIKRKLKRKSKVCLMYIISIKINVLLILKLRSKWDKIIRKMNSNVFHVMRTLMTWLTTGFPFSSSYSIPSSAVYKYFYFDPSIKKFFCGKYWKLLLTMEEGGLDWFPHFLCWLFSWGMNYSSIFMLIATSELAASMTFYDLPLGPYSFEE